jgi:hypothetical protein
VPPHTDTHASETLLRCVNVSEILATSNQRDINLNVNVERKKIYICIFRYSTATCLVQRDFSTVILFCESRHAYRDVFHKIVLKLLKITN